MENFVGSQINDIDILIVGAGPVGLATMLWFAKRKYKVLLVEQLAEIKNGKSAFNERHQQVGLNSETLCFLKNLDIIVWGEITRIGCADGDWINIPIYMLQNIFVKQLKTYPACKILFDTKIEAVTCFDPHVNCRVLLFKNNSSFMVYGVSPRLIVIADGKHDDRGTAKTFFNFSSASKVHLSTFGIVGMLERPVDNSNGSICLKNVSTDNYISESKPELGPMYIRLLGTMRERYVALGLGSIEQTNKFLALTPIEIKNLLIEAYNLHCDRLMGEFEIENFTQCSTVPIPIVLDYRKETIKLLEGSATIVSIEGDAARKTTFFSGSGLNSGYKALATLFNFCLNNETLVFGDARHSNYLLTLDQKLLQKDQECMHISYDLLLKGLTYVGNKHSCSASLCSTCPTNDLSIIESITPSEGEVPWFIHIKGRNLIGNGGKPPTCIFEWQGAMVSTTNVIVYNSDTVGVKVPGKAFNKVSIKLKRYDGRVVESPIDFQVLKLTDIPQINNIHMEDEWICLEGNNFSISSHVLVKDAQTEHTFKAYCNSVNSLTLSSSQVLALKGPLTFVVETDNGKSVEFKKEF